MGALENQPGVRAAMYARVSSDRQVQAQTIASQVEALQERLRHDGMVLDPELSFIDDGYSGATLVRPALERLRDMASLGLIERLYVHTPDRLSRKHAYQVLLLEELRREGVEVIFLDHAARDDPQERLLLEVQGIVAEYERAKITNGVAAANCTRRVTARSMSSGRAPYGYRYVPARVTGGHASYEIVLEQARVVRQILRGWVRTGSRCTRSLPEAAKRGHCDGNRQILVGSLRRSGACCTNPAYQGQAAYGRTRRGPRRSHLRPQRGDATARPAGLLGLSMSRRTEQMAIAVPALVEPDLFAAVQEQLEENRRQQRERRTGARYLLAGLLVCGTCGHAYYGRRPVSLKARQRQKRSYAYYRCIGSDAYRCGGQRLCWNTQVRTDRLEASGLARCLFLAPGARADRPRARATLDAELRGQGSGIN